MHIQLRQRVTKRSFCIILHVERVHCKQSVKICNLGSTGGSDWVHMKSHFTANRNVSLVSELLPSFVTSCTKKWVVRILGTMPEKCHINTVQLKW